MRTININGKDYTVEELTKVLEDAKKVNSLDAIFKYHNTTQEEFDKLYEKIPAHVKAYEMECMLVAFYNKGWVANFNNDERKHYPYFYLGENFRLCGVSFRGSSSDVSSRLCWKKEEDFREAFKLYPEIFKQSRQS